MRRAKGKLRFAVFGAGFWTPYQLAGWREVGSVECVAIYNRTRTKGEAIARQFDIPAVYDDAERLLAEVQPDFVDNITEVGGHKPLSLLCARHRIPCICQKPMAASLKDAREMVAAFARARTPFFVHENWRWQTPMRKLKELLDDSIIGTPFRARFTVISGVEPWKNQPALKELTQFILTDLGTHLLDMARCCFGEASSVYCQTHRTLPKLLKGENVATVVMDMGPARTTGTCEVAYAGAPLERECFPETRAFLEGPDGSIEVAANYWIRITNRRGTVSRQYAPTRYPWANPQYEVAHASIVPCCANLLAGLRGTAKAETTGADNLETMKLVFAAYESAQTGKAVHTRRN